MPTHSGFRLFGATLLALVSGCAALDVDMTSSPQVVRRGQPVTFDITLTNRSQCPLKTSGAELTAFIPAEHFFNDLIGDVPSDPSPEVLEFLEELRRFFDELCSGGEPELPEVPMLSTSCARNSTEIVCQMSMALPAHQGNTGSATFAGLGDRLQCELDDATMRCQLRIPLPQGAETADAIRATLADPLSCVPLGDNTAICFVGQALGPNGIANGQVSLPAQGSGRVRNIVIAIADEDDELGVCKGGSNPGDACAQDDDTDCQDGGSCGEGICDGGGNDGLGCDASTAMVDCPGGTCVLCDDFAENGFLPIDCTETIIAAEPAPVMSPWTLAGLATVLLLFGALWLRRTAR